MNVIRLLSDMVAIPSMNPMGRGLSGEMYGERAMADYVEEFFHRISVDCLRQEVLPGRENVIAIVEGEDKEGAIILEAHTATVLGGGMGIEPFDPVVKEGRLYGRGSCDTKGSLAAMMTAISRAIKSGKPPQTIILGATADEEYQFSGVRGMIDFVKTNLPNLRATGIVGEPTTLDLGIAPKGCYRWRLRTLGRAGHSSKPDEGVNAIYSMAKVITVLEEYAKEIAARRAHPLVGPPTLSVGTIKGGQTVNTIPDLCEIEIDRRTLPGEGSKEVAEDLNGFLRRHLGPGLEYEIAPVLEDLAMHLKEDDPIVQTMRGVV